MLDCDYRRSFRTHFTGMTEAAAGNDYRTRRGVIRLFAWIEEILLLNVIFVQ